MRWILIALLIVNVAVFAWFWRAGSGAEPLAPAEVPGAVPELVLLSEAGGSRDLAGAGQSGAAPLAGSSEPAPGLVSSPGAAACYQLGPFPARLDAEEFMRAFSGEFALSLDSSQRQVRNNYRVYLPPYPDRETAQAAFAELRGRLEAAGLTLDNFLIGRGDLENGIALGLFSEQRNAQNVESRLAELGYDVTIAEEPVFQDELWIRLVEKNDGVNLATRWPQMQAGRSWLQRTEKLC